MKIKKDQFIWIIDDFISHTSCDDVINIFKEKQEREETMTRLQSEGLGSHLKNDEAVTLYESKFESEFMDRIKPLLLNLNTILKQYLKEYGLFEGHRPFHDPVKVQKTIPGGGYHMWHNEKGYTYATSNRFLAWTLYLNDVEEGGETEFLYQSVRVKAKKGRFCIWPAGFPYEHRGNPPLSGEKYIATSWVRVPYDEDLFTCTI